MPVFYVAIVERGEGGCYGVFFPDVPGCVSVGDTVQEAAENAAEALGLHFDDTDERPAARAPDSIKVDDEVVEVMRILIPAPEADGPNKRYRVSLPSGLVRRIDRHVGIRQRSTFLAAAARKALERT